VGIAGQAASAGRPSQHSVGNGRQDPFDQAVAEASQAILLLRQVGGYCFGGRSERGDRRRIQGSRAHVPLLPTTVLNRSQRHGPAQEESTHAHRSAQLVA